MQESQLVILCSTLWSKKLKHRGIFSD